MSKGTLVLVRHGESRFNELRLFTGCVDVSLSINGIKEAYELKDCCKNNNLNYDVVFTSNLKRAQETLLIVLAGQKKVAIFKHEKEKRYDISDKVFNKLKNKIIPAHLSAKLNERSYGLLQGMSKVEANELYGQEQVFKWRRGFKDRPPKGESLQDVYKRAVPYFKKMVLPGLKRGETNLIVAHGNTLRAIIKYLEKIEDDKIVFINLPFAEPIVYEFEDGSFQRTYGKYDYERGLR